jgi:hypothetical protein
MLPGLTKLLGYGFTVDVAAVRQAELGAEGEGDEDHDEDHDVRDTLSRVLCQEALRACIAPEEGEVPQKLLLAAVALAASGTIGGIPVQQLREGSVKELDLRDCHLGHVATRLLAMMLPINGALTKLSLAKNKWGEEGAKFLCDALVGNDTLKELDLSGDQGVFGSGSNIAGTAGAKHVANMLLVNGALTEVRWPSVFGPQIVTCSELTACALCIQVNLDGYALPIKKLKGTEPVESLDLSNKRLGVASAIVIASLIGVNGALTEVH